MKKKNLLKWLYLLIILLIVAAYATTATTTTTSSSYRIENPEVIKLAQKLPHSGVLRANRGYIYLKVDDRYINELFPLLDIEGYEKPPYFRRPNATGAHISVMYEEETYHLPPIIELGNEYSFTIQDLAVVGTRQKYIVLQVSSPELVELRKSYGLKPLLHGFEFHISIAKQKTRRYW